MCVFKCGRQKPGLLVPDAHRWVSMLKNSSVAVHWRSSLFRSEGGGPVARHGTLLVRHPLGKGAARGRRTPDDVHSFSEERMDSQGLCVQREEYNPPPF